jgi:hypothetical protein
MSQSLTFWIRIIYWIAQRISSLVASLIFEPKAGK